MADKDDYKITNPFDSWVGPLISPGLDRLDKIVQDAFKEVRTAFRSGANDESVKLSTLDDNVYTTYAGVDIVAQLIVPGEGPITLGELQTFSYSTHREKYPIRLLGHVNPAGFTNGPRTVAGSMIFTVFNSYAFYRLEHMKRGIEKNVYPLVDMLPPFDIVLTFANETGSFSKLKIFGMCIIDEGQTMSIEDLVTEQTYQWTAQGIQPLTGYSPIRTTESRTANNG